MDSGPPGWFGGMIALVVVAGIIGLVARIAIARNVARRVGVDEDAATAAAVFGTGTVTSLYLDAHRQDVGPGSDAGHAIADLSPGRERASGVDEPMFPRHEG